MAAAAARSWPRSAANLYASYITRSTTNQGWSGSTTLPSGLAIAKPPWWAQTMWRPSGAQEGAPLEPLTSETRTRLTAALADLLSTK